MNFYGNMVQPFTAEVTWQIAGNNTGGVVDIATPVKDVQRANVVLLQNAGPDTVAVAFGPLDDVSVGFPVAGSPTYGTTVLIPGTAMIFPVAALPDMALAYITAAGKTCTLWVSRGWGA